MNKSFSRNWKTWLKAALIRAVKTLAQAVVSGIAVGAALDEVQWTRVVSVGLVSFILSLMTSLAGLPEVEQEAFDEAPQAESI